MLHDIGGALVGVEPRTHMRILYVLYTYRNIRQLQCGSEDQFLSPPRTSNRSQHFQMTVGGISDVGLKNVSLNQDVRSDLQILPPLPTGTKGYVPFLTSRLLLNVRSWASSDELLQHPHEAAGGPPPPEVGIDVRVMA